ncbi:hypothetical protein ACJZ2D_012138 [Fusarium nematophilum]
MIPRSSLVRDNTSLTEHGDVPSLIPEISEHTSLLEHFPVRGGGHHSPLVASSCERVDGSSLRYAISSIPQARKPPPTADADVIRDTGSPGYPPVTELGIAGRANPVTAQG